MHLNGHLSTPPDLKEAVRWISRSAELSHPLGQFQMGVLYAAGRGVEESDSEAIRWFNAAAKSGHSQGNLGVKQILERARERKQAAAGSGGRRGGEGGD